MHNSLIKICLLYITICYTCLAGIAQQVKEPAAMNDDWSKNYKPFRIAGNLYYVGTYDLASYLIATPKGHVLINTGLAASASLIKTNVESLGFKMKDIRILLTNQAHYDHVGAMAAIKKMTGAQLMVDEKDAPIVADGGVTDYYFAGKDPSFQPVRADRLLHDRDTISIGGTTIMMLHHPGHTKGSSSYLVNISDQKRNYRVLIANMPSIIIEKKFSEITSYPEMAADYKYTLKAMQELEFDIWVAAHASQFDLHKKRNEGDVYNPNLFADKKDFTRRINKINEAYNKKIAEQ